MIIFDIDGVLADSNWRTKKYLNEKNIDWQSYFDDAIYDLPIQSGILIAKAFINFLPQTEILFLTGRIETVRNETLAWLSEQLQIDKSKIDLTMRETGNYIESVKFKEEVGREIGFKNIDLVFEDNPKIVSMWRKHGVPCYQTCEYVEKS
jgi:hypothetical protein